MLPVCGLKRSIKKICARLKSKCKLIKQGMLYWTK